MVSGTNNQLWVGNLSRRITKEDINERFSIYGKVTNIRLKNNEHGVYYAFVDFEEHVDAERCKGTILFSN